MKNNYIYMILVFALCIISCEDKYKNELEQVKKDLEQIKKDNEGLRKENSQLEKEQAELAKANQVTKLDNMINWYVRTDILGNDYDLDFEDVSIKNEFEGTKLIKTYVRYSNGRLEEKQTKKVNLTIIHTLDQDGVLIKSECPSFSLKWTWETGGDVKILINNDKGNREVHSNKNNIINKVVYLNSANQKVGESIYQYNDVGELLKLEYFRKEKLQTGYYYEYNNKNLLVKYSIKYNVEPKAEFVYTYTYDSKDRVIKVYTPKDRNEEEEIEQTFSYDDGYTCVKKNKTTQMFTTTKYKDTSKKEELYKKIEDKKRRSVREYFYENDCIVKTLTNYIRDEYKELYTTINTIENKKLISKIDTYEKKDNDNQLLKKTITTYTEIKYKDKYDIGKSIDVYKFAEYIIAKEELKDGAMKLVTKEKYMYRKDSSGSWILDSKTDLLNE